MEIFFRGRKKDLTPLEGKFWDEFLGLLVDDPETKLNEIISILRETAIKYFKRIENDTTQKEQQSIS